MALKVGASNFLLAKATLNGNNFLEFNSGDEKNIVLVSTDSDSVTPVSVVGSQITLPDATATLNGNDFLTIPSGENKDIVLQDQNNNPIIPDSVVDETVTVNVPVGDTLPLNSGALIIRADDDGSTNFGRLTDFYTLKSNNHFGNLQRFTGITGGYFNVSDSTYRDVNDTITIEALAFPNDIALDWAQRSDTQVTAYTRNATSFATTTDMMAAQPITIFGTSFMISTVNELLAIRNYAASGSGFDYNIIKVNVTTNNTSFIKSRTFISNGNPLQCNSGFNVSQVAEGTQRQSMYTGYINISAL